MVAKVHPQQWKRLPITIQEFQVVKFLLAVLNVECPLRWMVGMEIAYHCSVYLLQTHVSDVGGGADEQAEA